MTRTIAPRELADLLESDYAPVVLDVRRPSDYEQDEALLPGAAWRDPGQVEQWALKLPSEREVVIYCVRGGSVSNSVLDALLAQGVRARYVEGGLEAWKRLGGRTVAG